MIGCVIEFSVRQGREADHKLWLDRLLPLVAGVDGFVSKETFESRAVPGRFLTVSYWESREALQAWMRDGDHRAAMKAGRDGIFSFYRIRVGEIEREYGFDEAEEAKTRR
jgi:heme-degrading monooxygenase HmoA